MVKLDWRKVLIKTGYQRAGLYHTALARKPTSTIQRPPLPFAQRS